MNDIVLFDYCGKGIRTIEKDGEVWWVLADVCKILGITNPSRAAKQLEEDERANFKLGRQGNAIHINESGLYSLILRSDKPEAKPFRRWITHEVIPQIRKSGQYLITTEQTYETTWYGEKVLSAVNAGKMLGVSRSSARGYIMRNLRDGLDYFVLKGLSLKLYKHENPTEPDFGGSVMLVRANAFYSIMNNTK